MSLLSDGIEPDSENEPDNLNKLQVIETWEAKGDLPSLRTCLALWQAPGSDGVPIRSPMTGSWGNPSPVYPVYPVSITGWISVSTISFTDSTSESKRVNWFSVSFSKLPLSWSVSGFTCSTCSTCCTCCTCSTICGGRGLMTLREILRVTGVTGRCMESDLSSFITALLLVAVKPWSIVKLWWKHLSTDSIYNSIYKIGQKKGIFWTQQIWDTKYVPGAKLLDPISVGTLWYILIQGRLRVCWVPGPKQTQRICYMALIYFYIYIYVFLSCTIQPSELKKTLKLESAAEAAHAAGRHPLTFSLRPTWPCTSMQPETESIRKHQKASEKHQKSLKATKKGNS